MVLFYNVADLNETLSPVLPYEYERSLKRYLRLEKNVMKIVEVFEGIISRITWLHNSYNLHMLEPENISVHYTRGFYESVIVGFNHVFRSNGTLFPVWYWEKDIQDIQNIRENTQYQKIDALFTPPNTFSPKLDLYKKISR